MAGSRFMTLKETAEFLGLSLRQIHELSRQNRLPGRVAWSKRMVRVDRLSLETWLADNTAANGRRELPALNATKHNTT